MSFKITNKTDRILYLGPYNISPFGNIKVETVSFELSNALDSGLVDIQALNLTAGQSAQEIINTTYVCVTPFTGASDNDIISSIQVISIGTVSTTLATIWHNKSTSLDLLSAPDLNNLRYIGSSILSKQEDAVTGLPVTQKSSSGKAHILTHTLDSTSGLPVAQTSINGAVPITIGAVGTNHNRNINAASSTYLAATNATKWAASEAVVEVSITPISLAVSTVTTDTPRACLVLFNMGTDDAAAAIAAAAAFANTGTIDAATISTAVSYAIIKDGETYTRSFTIANPLTRIDVLPIGTGNTSMRVGIETIGAA